MRSEGERSPRSTPVAAPKKKRGFCECCQETFEELQQVKAPLGPGSLEELRGPLSGFVNRVMPVVTANPVGRWAGCRTCGAPGVGQDQPHG